MHNTFQFSKIEYSETMPIRINVAIFYAYQPYNCKLIEKKLQVQERVGRADYDQDFSFRASLICVIKLQPL